MSAVWLIVSRIWLFPLSWSRALNFLLQLCQWFQEYLLSLCLQSIYSWCTICFFFSLFQVMHDACKCFGLLFVSFVPCGRITNGIPQALKLFQNKAFTCEYKYAFYSLVDNFFSNAVLISSMQFFKVSLNHIIN